MIMRMTVVTAAALAVALAACGSQAGEAEEGNVVRGNVMGANVAGGNVMRPEDSAPPQQQDGGTVTQFSEQDPAMNRAIAEAQATLPAFLAELSAGRLADADPMIKYRMTTTSGGVEHIWVANPRVQGDRISGVLANQPVEAEPGLSRGSPVSFSRSEVSDWSYTRNDRMWGNYTTRVMLDRIDPQQAAELQAALSPTPTEP